MKIKEFGYIGNPTIVLLHGGGLSWWAYEDIINLLKDRYYIIAPIIDGHGEDAENTFLSIEDCANKIIEYIDLNFDGEVFTIAGLSLGAQILCDILAKRDRITKYAIVESALVCPIKSTKALMVPLVKMAYPFSKFNWFIKSQAKSLNIKPDMQKNYREDIVKMSKETLVNITKSNGTYVAKDNISKTKAKVLIAVGGKEIKIMKKSAYKLKELIEYSKLHVGENMSHGELSIRNSGQFIELFEQLISD